MPRSMTEFVKQGGRYASRLKSNHVVHNLDSRVSTTYTRSMVYKKHREIQYSSVSKIDLKNVVLLLILFLS